MANANRDPKKRSQPFTLEDFMPQPPKPKKVQADWRGQHAQLLGWKATFQSKKPVQVKAVAQRKLRGK